MSSPYEQNVAVLEQNVRQTIARLKREGIVGMSRDNLKMVISTRGLSFPSPYVFNQAFGDVCDRIKVKGFEVYHA